MLFPRSLDSINLKSDENYQISLSIEALESGATPDQIYLMSELSSIKNNTQRINRILSLP